MDPWPEATEESDQVRKEPLQMAQQDQDHVRQAQRLAARHNPIRQMPEGLSLGHRPCRTRNLPATRPEPFVSQLCYVAPVSNLGRGC